MFWLPVVYPGFSWDNLQRLPPGKVRTFLATAADSSGSSFTNWSRLGVDSVYVAMFDEVDEGTAIFKVTERTAHSGSFCRL